MQLLPHPQNCSVATQEKGDRVADSVWGRDVWFSTEDAIKKCKEDYKMQINWFFLTCIKLQLAFIKLQFLVLLDHL